MSDMTEKIGKLLMQAAGTHNENEKQAYFAQAQKLASKHSIELAVARAAAQKKQGLEQPTHTRITIGPAGKPLNAVFCELIMDIGRAQDLKFNIAHNSTYVIAFGMPSDIEVMETLYAHIAPQMIEMADAFIKSGEWKGETQRIWDSKSWNYIDKPVHSRVARRQFYEAFSGRVGQRLREAKREAIAEAEERDRMFAEAANVPTGEEGAEVTRVPFESTSTALAIRDKELEIVDYYQKTSNARGSWKGNRNTYTSNAGRSAGRSAGDRAQLHSRKGIGG